LQYYFQTPQDQQSNFTNPYQQKRIDDYEKKLQQYRGSQEQAKEQSGYVVRPDPTNKIWGLSTFTTTAGKVIQSVKSAFGTLRRYIPFGGQQKPPPPPPRPNPLEMINIVQNPAINDPYRFYYTIVKPLLGRDTRNVYRTYRHEYIYNIQIRRP
jgi:hypothetical protein